MMKVVSFLKSGAFIAFLTFSFLSIIHAQDDQQALKEIDEHRKKKEEEFQGQEAITTDPIRPQEV